MPTHEHDRIAVSTIAALLVALVAVILGCAGASWWLLAALGTTRSDNAQLARANPLPAFAAPRLQPAPQFDIDAYRAEKKAQLSSYRWIDRERGIVAIPIERAMELLAQREAGANGGTR